MITTFYLFGNMTGDVSFTFNKSTITEVFYFMESINEKLLFRIVNYIVEKGAAALYPCLPHERYIFLCQQIRSIFLDLRQ